MKVILLLIVTVAAVVARPQESVAPGTIPILDYQETRDQFGQFALSYLTGDGTRVSEQGALIPNPNGEGLIFVKKGSFSYYSPEGVLIEETWDADADGFRPEGSHLPTTPASTL